MARNLTLVRRAIPPNPMQLTRLLAFRLFVIVLFVMLVGAFATTTLVTDWLEARQMENMIAWAGKLSDIIKRSTHYSMLLNRREDVDQIITTVGHEPGIEAIRIYNKKGLVTISTDSSEVGSYADMKSQACVACHRDGQPPISLNPLELTRTYQTSTGHRVLGLITPIYNEPTCSTADCHAHEPSQTVLGVLDVIMPLAEHDALIAEIKREQYIAAGVLVLVVTGIAGLFIWRMVNVPVRRLSQGTQEVIKGNLSHRIPVKSKDELGMLAQSFNHMTDELNRARQEIIGWTETLEHRVQEKTDELKRAQTNLIHVEKMASLGKLAATVAHELNNPLEGVLTYAKLLKKKLSGANLPPERLAEIDQELGLIADETARCGSIVKNLLLFSRQRIGKFQVEDLRSIIEQSLRLVDHHLVMHNIRLETRLGDRPILIECDAQQIEQALLALEINAVEAMSDGGTLQITLEEGPAPGTVTMKVEDNGSGIPAEDLPHIFEPFFTTKEEGKGTGLGLSVVYGIVDRHNGIIRVESTPGQGTTFIITLSAHTQAEKPE